ncbi:MAG: hypothetical protein QXS02_00630 [Candidatus Thermoplasmatota archaeon]
MTDEGPKMCKNCGAPLEFGYGATVITCDYCGSSMTLSGDVAKLISKHTMLLNKITRDDAINSAKKWMDAGIFRVNVARDSQIGTVELKYLPVWIIPVTIRGNYEGVFCGGYHADGRLVSDSFKQKDAKGVLSGIGKIAGRFMLDALSHSGSRDNRRSEEYRSGVINDQYYELILARRSTTMDLTKYPIPLGGKAIFDLNKVKSTGGEILDGDMLEDEAKAKAEVSCVEKTRRKLSHQIDRIQRFDIKTEIGEGELIHVPIWLVHYIHKGIERVCGVDGVSCTPVNGDRPTVSLGILGKGKEATPEQEAAPQ